MMSWKHLHKIYIAFKRILNGEFILLNVLVY